MISFHKVISLIRDIWVIIGIVVLVLIFFDLELSCVYFIVDHSNHSSRELDSRFKADAYNNAPWVKKYYMEFRAAGRCRWEPFVYWRKQMYKGEYINIDEQGRRRVVGQMADPAKKAASLRVFMFGGSTLWGEGARDAFTIPSIIQQGLTDRGLNVQVVNFGEDGYVSTQEVIELMLQLQKKKIPDIVIFYDGVNDVFSAYQNKIAGITYNENNRRIEFNLANSRWEHGLTALALKSIVNNLSLTRLVRSYAGKFTRQTVNMDAVNDKELDLTGEIKDVYENNMMIVNALAKRYKFQCVFYWQPSIFEKSKLSGYEKQEQEKRWSLERFFKEADGSMVEDNISPGNRKDFHNISGIFANVTRPVFIDAWHTGEDGNNIVADRMLEDLLPIIRENNKFTKMM